MQQRQLQLLAVWGILWQTKVVASVYSSIDDVTSLEGLSHFIQLCSKREGPRGELGLDLCLRALGFPLLCTNLFPDRPVSDIAIFNVFLTYTHRALLAN